MRTNKRRDVQASSLQLCLFTPAEMKAMEERKVNYKPVIDIIRELELLPILKGQLYRDQRAILLNKSLNERLRVAPGVVSNKGIRTGIRVIDS